MRRTWSLVALAMAMRPRPRFDELLERVGFW
jgi:hypothetical protein